MFVFFVKNPDALTDAGIFLLLSVLAKENSLFSGFSALFLKKNCIFAG